MNLGSHMLPVVRLFLDFTDHKSVIYNGDSDMQILRPKTLNANLPINDFNRKQVRNKKDSTKRLGNKTEILYSLLRVRFIQHSESLKYVCLQCYCKVRHCRPCFLKGPRVPSCSTAQCTALRRYTVFVPGSFYLLAKGR
jgi:hypothetical protein